MHEMGITSGILASAIEAAEAEGATRINEVDISIGDLTEIVEDALQFAWEALSPGTMAEGSKLVVNHIPARSRCMQCDKEFEHDKYDLTCPTCDAFMIESLTGRELRIDSIDVD
jgi:hydrogenase nickel incorporation protein HypA/HybF